MIARFSVILSTICVGAAWAKQPNVLILYADDLGFGDLGCYNKESRIPTPNLDRLASESVRFTDGHSSSGICTPSRFAMLTGRCFFNVFLLSHFRSMVGRAVDGPVWAILAGLWGRSWADLLAYVGDLGLSRGQCKRS